MDVPPNEFTVWPVRRMTTADLPAVLEIERQIRARPWTAETFQREIDNPLSRAAVVLQEEAVSGYGLSWLVGDELQIHYLAVDERWRGRGLGELLLFDAIQAGIAAGAVLSTLEVRETNTPARKLYEKYGYVAVGRRAAYYRESGEDALLMNALLDTAAVQETLTLRAKQLAQRLLADR